MPNPLCRLRWRLLAASAVALACSPCLRERHAGATIVIEMSVAELAASADLVVRGTVVRSGTRVAALGGALTPRTHTWIEIAEPIAGRPAAAGSVVELSEPGGAYAEVWVETSGVPRYRVGEEVVVFLRADPARPGVYRTHELSQGKYQVFRGGAGGEPVVARDLHDVAFASWGPGGLALRPAFEGPPRAPLRLAALVEAVRKHARPAPARAGGPAEERR